MVISDSMQWLYQIHVWLHQIQCNSYIRFTCGSIRFNAMVISDSQVVISDSMQWLYQTHMWLYQIQCNGYIRFTCGYIRFNAMVISDSIVFDNAILYQIQCDGCIRYNSQFHISLLDVANAMAGGPYKNRKT